MQVMPATTYESISAGPGDVVRGRAGRDEDAGADDRADAEARELDGAEHAAQPVLAGHLLQQLRERFRREQLAHHANLRADYTLLEPAKRVEIRAHARARIAGREQIADDGHRRRRRRAIDRRPRVRA